MGGGRWSGAKTSQPPATSQNRNGPSTSRLSACSVPGGHPRRCSKAHRSENVWDPEVGDVEGLVWRNGNIKSSGQFSHPVVSDSLYPQGLQHTRLPCLSPTPRACSNSCPLSQWCHPTISPSVVTFSCLPSFSATGSFLMSQFFTSVAKVLELQLQHQSFHWILRTDFL